MEQPILQLGNNKWAVRESGLLGYTQFDGFKDVDSYTADEFSFTRATSGTITNSQGLIEDSCYNLFQSSEAFDNAVWNKGTGIVVTPNAIANPVDGAMTADFWDATSSSNSPGDTAQIVVARSTSLTYSFYIKSGNAVTNRFNIVSTSGGALGVATLTYSTGIITGVGWSVNALPNGWFKVVFKASIGITIGDNLTCYIGRYSLGTNATWYLYGAQLVSGTTERPYLKTTNRLNVPRIDNSLGYPALLLEPQRTNSVLWSEDFTNAAWIKNDTTVTANTNTNPFGVNKSHYLIDSATNTTHNIAQSRSITSGTTYSFSYYIKKAAHTWIQLTHLGSVLDVNFWVNFNFDTGLFGNMGIAGTWIAKPLANGWYQISGTVTAIGTTTTSVASVVGTNNTNSATRLPVYVGIGANICEVAAIQMEVGSNATTYIPTTTTTVTRNGDVSSYNMQATNMFNPDNFTLFAEGFHYSGSQNNISLELSVIDGGLAADCIGFYNNVVPIWRDSTNTQTTINNQLAENSFYKFIIQKNGTSLKFFRNGVQLGTTQTLSATNYQYLRMHTGSSTYNIKSLKLYDRTLSDAECQTLTTL